MSKNRLEQNSNREQAPDVNLHINMLDDDYRVLEFDSSDVTTCKAYITAIADVLSSNWPDDGESKPEHIREILLKSNIRDEKVMGGHYSFPLSFHDIHVEEDDERLLAKIHEKAKLIYEYISDAEKEIVKSPLDTRSAD